jgi:hypothetical protein
MNSLLVQILAVLVNSSRLIHPDNVWLFTPSAIASLLMAENTALRMELDRNQRDLGSLPQDVNQPQPSVMVPPRRHSEGITTAYPMGARRFSDDPRTLNVLRSQQMQWQQVGISPGMLVEAAYQPPTGPSQSTIEQVQRGFALQRAADLGRADLARWNDQAASPTVVPRSSPPAAWSSSSVAQPPSMTATAQEYQLGARPAQFLFANPMDMAQYAQGLQLQPTARVYNPTFQAVPSADVQVQSAPQGAQAMQMYPAQLGPFQLRAPTVGEVIPQGASTAPQPPAQLPPQGPPQGWM